MLVLRPTTQERCLATLRDLLHHNRIDGSLLPVDVDALGERDAFADEAVVAAAAEAFDREIVVHVASGDVRSFAPAGRDPSGGQITLAHHGWSHFDLLA